MYLKFINSQDKTIKLAKEPVERAVICDNSNSCLIPTKFCIKCFYSEVYFKREEVTKFIKPECKVVDVTKKHV